MRAYGGNAIKTLGCAFDDDTGERMISQGGGFVACFEEVHKG